MATAITPTVPNRTGVTTPTLAACDLAGNTVPNTSGLILMFENSDVAGPHTVVFTTPAEHAGFAVADYTLTLAASAKKTLSGFSGDAFGRTLAFMADDTDVKVAAISVVV